MKKLILLFLLTFIAYNYGISQADDYKVEWGPVYKKEYGLFSIFELLGIRDNHYYLLAGTLKSPTLLKFDLNHKLITSKAINMEYEGEKAFFSQFIDTKNGTFAYMPQYNKGTWRMLISKLEGDGFGKIREVYSQDFEVKRFSLYGMGMDADAMDKNVVVSLNKNKVAYTNILSMKEKNDEEAMKVAVFNADLELEWEKEQKFPYKDKAILIKQRVVSSTGVVYVLATISDKGENVLKEIHSKKKKDKEDKYLPKYHYSIFRITKDDMKEFPIDLKNDSLAAKDIAMYFPKKNRDEIIVTGFYTNSERKSKIKGFFYASGNVNEGISTVKIHKFEDSFSGERGLSFDYRIDKFTHFSDGSLGFVAELFYYTVRTSTNSNGSTTTSITYYGGNLIVPRFSKEGELLNTTLIKRRYGGKDPLLVSYSMALANDKLYFVFNDYKYKAEREKLQGMKSWRSTDLVVINAAGEIEYNETLFNSKEIDLTFVPTISAYSDNILIVTSAKKKKYAFGTIKLK